MMQKTQAKRRRTWIACVFASMVALSSCGGDGDRGTTTSTTTSTTSSSTTTPDPIGAPPALKVAPVATLAEPVAFAQRDSDDALFIAERRGVVRIVRNGVVDPTPALDISRDVRSNGSEQGLLGLAFAPKTSKLYFNYTDLNGDTHVDEITVDANGIGDVRSRRSLLTQDQPFPNHNGGHLAFGPDGMLYIGLGDGGSAGDPQKNGQDLSTLLGKMLRIDPTPSASAPYTIPFDNPFVKQTGVRGEIWAYGLRNPWRYSFDRDNKSLWIADVGQGKREEIDMVTEIRRGGHNFGWSLREGTQRFNGEKPTGSIDPVHEYDHSDGACSVTGGYVYRGEAIPDLTARYLFGDYCNGKISALTRRGDAWQVDATTLNVPNLTSFGEDHNGELYVLSQTGLVGRIEPA